MISHGTFLSNVFSFGLFLSYIQTRTMIRMRPGAATTPIALCPTASAVSTEPSFQAISKPIKYVAVETQFLGNPVLDVLIYLCELGPANGHHHVRRRG